MKASVRITQLRQETHVVIPFGFDPLDKLAMIQQDCEVRLVYTMISVGWQSGARCRVRRFNTVPRLQAYLNKLLIGGYLSDESYHKAYCASDTFQGSTVFFDDSLSPVSGTKPRALFEDSCYDAVE
jgi:hypothetical protein